LLTNTPWEEFTPPWFSILFSSADWLLFIVEFPLSSDPGTEFGYGYLWWSARACKYDFNYAWGHGGNLIVQVHDLDLEIVTTVNTLPGLPGEGSWPKDRAIIDLMGKYVRSLPQE